MATLLELYRKHQTTLPSTHYVSDLKLRFEKYLLARFSYIADIEANLILSFKDSEDEEDANSFFELNILRLLDELNFHIMSYDGFRVVDYIDKVKKLLNQMLKALYGNTKNNEITLKALDNIQLIANFFTALKTKSTEMLELLYITEKEFDIVNTPPKLKVALESTEEVCIRMMKSVRKIKRTQITFTIDDELLSALVNEHERVEIRLEHVMQHFDNCSTFFEAIQQDIETILQTDLSIQNDEVDSRVKNVIKQFFDFFINDRNHVNMFLMSCYIYREKLIEHYTEESSRIVNLLLNKLTCYRTFVMIKYYEENVETSTEKDLKLISKRLRRFFDSKSITQDFEQINEQVSKAKLAILFIRDSLIGKKSDNTIFNNSFINEKMTVLIPKLDKDYNDITRIGVEITIIEAILPLYDDYMHATSQIKLINLRSTRVEDKLTSQKILRRFNTETKKLEKLLYDYRMSNAMVYQQICDIIEGNKIIAEEYRSLCLLMHK